jgi:hypothetical protein
MPVSFQPKNITIPSGTGTRSIDSFVTFGSSVIRAGVALNSFKLDYLDSDHHINIVEVNTELVSISGNIVTFRVKCLYADKNFDDPYGGYVNVLVIAEVA